MPEMIASTYEIIEKIGSGGGGNVFLAYHVRLGKKVVIKADKRKITTKPKLSWIKVRLFIPVLYGFLTFKVTTEKYKKEHKLPKNQTDFEIVEVRTSPYGIVNWALQYSDKVELIGPESVVKSIKERVEELCKKYNVNV